MVAQHEIGKAVSLLAGKAALAAGSTLALAGVAAGYGMLEAQAFEVRRERLKVLPPGSADLKILHLSDIHMVPGQENKRRWLRDLAKLAPDFVVNTGDNLSHPHGVEPLLEALEPLMQFPGAFVPGSNCYFAPRPRNPLLYFGRSKSSPTHSSKFKLPFEQMHQRFGAAGWLNLANRNVSTALNGIRLDLSGVDDPHIDLDAFAGWPAGSATSNEAPHVRIALTHAPYQRVLDQFTETRADVIFAGHTHGGQICVPGYGALVTNCDLPTWRARGLTHWNFKGRSTPLNVSAGIGTSRYVPIRIACRPEAVLVTLEAEQH